MFLLDVQVIDINTVASPVLALLFYKFCNIEFKWGCTYHISLHHVKLYLGRVVFSGRDCEANGSVT